jgi:hypothetical protein
MKRGKECNLAKRSNRPGDTGTYTQRSPFTNRRDSAISLPQNNLHDATSIVSPTFAGPADINQQESGVSCCTSPSLPHGNSLFVSASPAPTAKRGRSTKWRYEDSDEPHPTEYEAFQLIEALSAASAEAPEILRTRSHGRAASAVEPEISYSGYGGRAISIDATVSVQVCENSASQVQAAADLPVCGLAAKRPKLTIRCVRRPQKLPTASVPSVDAIPCMTPPPTDHGSSNTTSIVEADTLGIATENGVNSCDDMLDSLDDIDP